jgi:hypothetical protein
MSVVKALTAARKEFPQLVADEEAKMGAYRFKYSSLNNILNTVQPALLKHGIILNQEITSRSSTEVVVNTVLIAEDGTQLESGELIAIHDGSPIDLGKKATTLRRIQLVALLGIATGDEEVQEQQSHRQPTPVPKPAPKPVAPVTAKQLEARQRAAKLGETTPLSDTLLQFVNMMRGLDADEQRPMPIIAREGAKMSMYEALMARVNNVVGVEGAAEVVLSLVLARAITPETPPKAAHRVLLDQTVYDDALREAWNINYAG